MIRGLYPLAIAAALGGCVMGPDFPAVGEGFETQSHRVHGIQRVEPADHSPHPDRPILLLIHGTPGDWTNFLWYLADPRLQQQFAPIAVDRPGFGGSGDVAVPDLRLQAESILAAFPGDRPIFVAGHSLGAPIALWIALLVPERVTGVALLAGSVAPDLEQPRWFNRWADTWLAERLLPGVLLRSNAEVMALQAELEKLMPQLTKLRAPVLSVQGRDDELVNPASPDELKRWLPAGLPLVDLRIENEGHFIIWDRPELVRDTILEFHLNHPGPSA